MEELNEQDQQDAEIKKIVRTLKFLDYSNEDIQRFIKISAKDIAKYTSDFNITM